jgi:hypothetical protein
MDAMEQLIDRKAQNAINFLIPAMREVRQQSRFRALVREIGLVDYWTEFGWPEFCRPVDDGNF